MFRAAYRQFIGSGGPSGYLGFLESNLVELSANSSRNSKSSLVNTGNSGGFGFLGGVANVLSTAFTQRIPAAMHKNINKTGNKAENNSLIITKQLYKNTHNRYELSWVHILNLLRGMFNQLVPVTPRTCYGTKIHIFVYMKIKGEKISWIISHFCDGNADFARKLGEKPQTTSNWVSRGCGLNVLDKIITTFPDIDANWLIYDDKANPLRQQPEVTQIFHPKSIEKTEEDGLITLYDVEAAANLKSLFDNKDQNILGQINIPNIPKCDGAVYVKGDSMYPLLKSGDIVAYKEVPLEMSHIFFGEMYLVSIDLDGDEYLTVKYVQHSEKGEDWIKLVSYNQNHQPKDFPLSSVRAMALVKLSIRMNTMK